MLSTLLFDSIEDDSKILAAYHRIFIIDNDFKSGVPLEIPK